MENNDARRTVAQQLVAARRCRDSAEEQASGEGMFDPSLWSSRDEWAAALAKVITDGRRHLRFLLDAGTWTFETVDETQREEAERVRRDLDRLSVAVPFAPA